MIKSLRLSNFKCFEDITIPMANLTLLTGLNGMGKSSVIQSLLVLRQSFQQGLLPNEGLALNGELVNLGTAKAAFYEEGLTDTMRFYLSSNKKDSMTEFQFNYDSSSDVIKSGESSKDDTIYIESLFSDDFQYLQAERVGPRVTFPISEYFVRQHKQLGTRGEYTSHFLEVFGRNFRVNNELFHNNEPSDLLIHQVAAWLGVISPGVDIHIASHSNMDVVNLEFSYPTSKGRSGHFRSPSVGFGLTYALPIIVAILAAKPGAMLILENPEAHLHPQGQARIGELIALAANAGIQIILETHSDHILNGIRIAVRQQKCAPEKVAIHYLFRTEIEGRAQSVLRSPKIDKDGRIDQWPEGFFDEWEKSLENLF